MAKPFKPSNAHHEAACKDGGRLKRADSTTKANLFKHRKNRTGMKKEDRDENTKPPAAETD